MNLARGIERRLENLVDGVSASVFRGKMHPVTIASRLVRQIDFVAFETSAGKQIPNDLTVVIHPADLDPAIDVAALETELDEVVTVAARENGWRLVGPVEVHLETSVDVPRGILECAGDSLPGHLEPWGQLIASDGSVVIPLAMNRTLIGRALDCDVRFSNAEVSRHHVVIARVGDQVVLRDVGSSNGTWVNNDRVAAKPVTLLPGSAVTLGNIPFTYRLVT
jgi:FhaA, N-terminal domain/FHA domain